MKILFAGTPEFAAQHLQVLLKASRTDSSKINILGVITQPDKPGKRGKKPVPSAVKRIALAADLPVIQPDRLVAADIEPFKPDLVIVVAYGQILRPSFLSSPRFGCINVHASLLPRWRGAAPIQRAILAGDTETGVCIMQMDKGLDTGDVLASQTIQITAQDTSSSLAEKLAQTGTTCLIDVIQQISEGSHQAIKQPDAGTCYAHKIDKAEAQLEWQLSAEELDRKVRAFNPEPMSFTFLNDLRVKVIQAQPQASESTTKKPGQILDISKRGILVACGSDCLLIERLQLPLGKGSILNGSDVLNARADLIFVGANFS